jgi:hypothetical protein
MKRRRARIVGPIAIAVLVLGFSAPAFASSTWSWKATGTVGLKTVCLKSTVPVSDHVCSYAVPNAKQTKGTESLLVMFKNATDKSLCFGVSISSSYDAGLQSVCSKPHAIAKYKVTGSVQHFRQTNVSLFVTSGSKSKPIAPVKPTASTNFQIVATANT